MTDAIEEESVPVLVSEQCFGWELGRGRVRDEDEVVSKATCQDSQDPSTNDKENRLEDNLETCQKLISVQHNLPKGYGLFGSLPCKDKKTFPKVINGSNVENHGNHSLVTQPKPVEALPLQEANTARSSTIGTCSGSNAEKNGPQETVTNEQPPIFPPGFPRKKQNNKRRHCHLSESSSSISKKIAGTLPLKTSAVTVKPKKTKPRNTSALKVKQKQSRIPAFKTKQLKPRDCSICGLYFKLSCQLRDHMYLHSGERPYSCLVCGNQYRIKEIYKSHLKSHKVNVNQFNCYKCIFCGKEGFGKYSVYHQHRKCVHHNIPYQSEQEKAFGCGVCLKPHFTRGRAIACALLAHDPTTLRKKMFKMKCAVCSGERLGYHSFRALGRHWEKEHGDKPLPAKCETKDAKKDVLPKVIINQKKAFEIKENGPPPGMQFEFPLFVEFERLVANTSEQASTKHYDHLQQQAESVEVVSGSRCDDNENSISLVKDETESMDRFVKDESIAPQATTSCNGSSPGLCNLGMIKQEYCEEELMDNSSFHDNFMDGTSENGLEGTATAKESREKVGETFEDFTVPSAMNVDLSSLKHEVGEDNNSKEFLFSKPADYFEEYNITMLKQEIDEDTEQEYCQDNFLHGFYETGDGQVSVEGHSETHNNFSYNCLSNNLDPRDIPSSCLDHQRDQNIPECQKPKVLNKKPKLSQKIAKKPKRQLNTKNASKRKRGRPPNPFNAGNANASTKKKGRPRKSMPTAQGGKKDDRKVCFVCGLKVSSVSILKRHILAEHIDRPDGNYENQQNNIITTESAEQNSILVSERNLFSTVNVNDPEQVKAVLGNRELRVVCTRNCTNITSDLELLSLENAL